jgi:acyl transferase domain-containing protein/acyl carrier protein
MAENNNGRENTRTGLEIAVIGMAGRFPGARDIHEYWENLKNGVESITFFSDEELEKEGVPADLVKNPSYVKAGGFLEKTEYFDASFFGYTPGEAQIMNPQMRIFHECAWHALEDAGYNPESYDGSIGIYAGAESGFHWQGLSLLSGKSSEIGNFAATQLTDIAFLTTHIAYKFNLKGPGAFVQTACSTSLVSIHMACRSVLSGECDMALAGGAGLNINQRRGYLYEEGMVLSPDGRCRAFDAGAKGTVGGSGAGIVVLKWLKKAIADRDHIYAIVKGTAVNNDGNRKAGYSAPSVQGQVEVIRTAQTISRIETESIGYIETHGTATPLGDPVEIEALTRAFNTGKRNVCPIGSVKTNIGHLGAVAGIAGFIKTVLALKNKAIPPSLHFKEPNPNIDFKDTPFYVNTKLSEWKNDTYPLRAGVSSFGIGGANAHAILEEAPQSESTSPGRPFQLLLLSAKTQSALDKKTEELAEHLNKNPGINLADAAYTMQVGRKTFAYRKAAVCSTVDEAVDLLSSLESGKVHTAFSNRDQRSIIFMFAGLGSQYVNMGADLYRHEPVFRQEMDHCFSILKSLGEPGPGLKSSLYPGPANTPANEAAGLHHIKTAQLAVFVLEYSLAKMIMNYGITPHAMIGYSLGEYAAACLSGVFSLEDALKLMVVRGRLMAEIPAGTMLSAPLSANQLEPFLNGKIAIAIDNGPSCILTGPPQHLDALQDKLKEKRYLCMRLPNFHASHSGMMAPILKEFEEFLGTITYNKPQIPYISNVTGQWIRAEDATDPAYWRKHLAQTVRFAAGIDLLKKKPNPIFIEIGPGRDLSALLVRHKEKNPDLRSVNLIRPSRQDVTDNYDNYYLSSKIGQLWLYGVTVDWEKFHKAEERRRIPLPTYPFEGQKYWLESASLDLETAFVKEIVNAGRKTGIADWYYIPSWKRSSIPTGNLKQIAAENPCRWLVFVDKCGLGIQLLEELKKAKQHVITVEEGIEFSGETGTEFTIQPGHDGDYEALFTGLSRNNKIPDKIVHLWGVTGGDQGDNGLDPAVVDAAQNLGFYSLLNIARALDKQSRVKSIEITVVTDNMLEVNGDDGLCPGKATVLGAIKSIPNEYSNIKCRGIDLSLSKKWSPRHKEPVRQLFNELMGERFDPVVAFRNFHRWEQCFEPTRLEKTRGKSFRLRQEGVYLVTGGLGGIGLLLAEHLAKTVRAKLVLSGRSPFPAREEWQRLLNREVNENDGITRKIQRLKAMEDNGAEVLVLTADVADEKQMRGVIDKTLEKFSRLNGVIHSAGLPDGELIRRKKRKTTENLLSAKVRGTLLLDRILKDIKLDFFVLCSSLASIQVGVGQAGYCAANNFLDAFAKYKFYNEGLYTVSINWDRWRRVGMAAIAEEMHKNLTGEELTGGMSPEQGVEAFNRIMDGLLPQVAVTPLDPMSKIELPGTLDISSLMENIDETHFSQPGNQRPDLETEYIAPRYELEQKIAGIWADFFGFQRVGIHDDFFDLGGDSLRAMAIASKIHKELDIEIAIEEFFKNPTIRGLAQYIEGADRKMFRAVERAEEKEFYPLSAAQQRFYLYYRMNPGSIAYNGWFTMQMKAGINREKLAEAFKQLIARHDCLRSSFHLNESEPVQIFHPRVDFTMDYYPLCHSSQPSSAAEQHQAVRHVIEQFIRPFDFSRAPLMRACLVQLPAPADAGDDAPLLLVIDMHHIITDGISTEILKQDFVAFYRDESLPALNLRYKDFVQWQAGERRQAVLARQKTFWLNQFEGKLPLLNLPVDYPRRFIDHSQGQFISKEIPPQTLKGLYNIVASEKTTPFTLMLSAYYVLLSKLSGQQDIIVGTAVSGRNHADLMKIVGLFMNTLALRNFPSGEKTFRRFLREVMTNTLKAFDNQDVGFDGLVDDLVSRGSLTRDPNRNPLFDTMFALFSFLDVWNQNGTVISTSDADGDSQQAPFFENRSSKFDLLFNAVEYREGIVLTLNFSTALFKPTTAESLLTHYLEILEQLVGNIDISLGDISLSSGFHEINSGFENANLTDFKF